MATTLSKISCKLLKNKDRKMNGHVMPWSFTKKLDIYYYRSIPIANYQIICLHVLT